MKAALFSIACLIFAAGGGGSQAEAGHYSTWTARGPYHYSHYYYSPTRYHYVVSFPSQPRYLYFFNPHSRLYWGRFDREGKPGAEFSTLSENDRREHLSEIQETAFPKPGKIPSIPDSDNDDPIDPPPAPPEVEK